MRDDFDGTSISHRSSASLTSQPRLLSVNDKFLVLGSWFLVENDSVGPHFGSVDDPSTKNQVLPLLPFRFNGATLVDRG